MNNILVKILNNKQIHIPSSFCLILDFVNSSICYKRELFQVSKVLIVSEVHNTDNCNII